MNEGSFDCDINEIPATLIAGQDPENYYNDNSLTVTKTVTVNTLSNNSSEPRPVDVRSNMPAITTRDSKLKRIRAALIVISMKPLSSPPLSKVPKTMIMVMLTIK